MSARPGLEQVCDSTLATVEGWIEGLEVYAPLYVRNLAVGLGGPRVLVPPAPPEALEFRLASMVRGQFRHELDQAMRIDTMLRVVRA